ncbi:transposase [Microbispora sp. H10830]|uniref:transposase n=1 Tax=Microbispora sp. H10830 TaxID=2729109 RepID=UPI001C71CD44
MPECYGSWQAVYALLRRWQRAGVWQEILTRLQALADAADMAGIPVPRLGPGRPRTRPEIGIMRGTAYNDGVPATLPTSDGTPVTDAREQRAGRGCNPPRPLPHGR